MGRQDPLKIDPEKPPIEQFLSKQAGLLAVLLLAAAGFLCSLPCLGEDATLESHWFRR